MWLAYIVLAMSALGRPEASNSEDEPTKKAPAGSRYLLDGYAYFANSYRLADPPSGWQCAIADYGGPFVAAIERGPVLACQFHPELSGDWGLAMLARWLSDRAVEGERC